mgnify:CR=1 FL=1
MARRNEIYPGTSIFREDLSGAGRKNGSSVTVIRRRSYVRAGRQPNNGNSAMARRNEIYPGTSIFREDYLVRADCRRFRARTVIFIYGSCISGALSAILTSNGGHND